MTNTTHHIDEWDQLLVIICREYLRVSRDRSGRVRSNDEQHDENVPAIDRQGWQLGEPYEDVGSASKFTKKRRPDFDRLIADLEGETFDAHVLALWECSRGSRKVSEWVRLLELCAERGVRIWVTTHDYLYDPRSPRDWKTLMDEAVDSEYEARKNSKRIRRSTDADASNGTAHGGRRPFGFKPGGIEPEPEEVAIIKRCIKLAIAGRSIRSLAAELNRDGIKTTAGNDWHPGVLRDVLTSQRMIGMRVHGPEKRVVGPGKWKPIIDDVTHRRLIATLAATSPVGRRGRTPWLLTGLLRCERCGAALVSNTDTGGVRRYVCRQGAGYRGCGGLGIKAEPLEELLGDLVMERLADVEARRQAVTGPDDSDEVAKLDAIAAQRIVAADDRALGEDQGGTSRATYNDLMAALDRRQRALESALAAKVRDVVPLDFVAAEGFVGRLWDDLTLDEQRLVLDALIDHVDVGPITTRGSRVFEPARVTKPGRIVWRV
jgi:DNA invertase Pin-like site-specific DNA recombinase